MDAETIDTFDIESLRLGHQEFCGMFNDCPRFKIENNKIFSCIGIDENLMIWCLSINIWVYSLGIDEGDTRNIKFFDKIKEKIGKLCKKFEGPVVIGAANFLDTCKPWRAHWEKNVNAKIHSGSFNRFHIPIWKLVKAKGGYKKKRISIKSIANKEFYGSCVIRINDILVDDSVKTLNLEVGRILVNPTLPGGGGQNLPPSKAIFVCYC